MSMCVQLTTLNSDDSDYYFITTFWQALKHKTSNRIYLLLNDLSVIGYEAISLTYLWRLSRKWAGYCVILTAIISLNEMKVMTVISIIIVGCRLFCDWPPDSLNRLQWRLTGWWLSAASSVSGWPKCTLREEEVPFWYVKWPLSGWLFTSVTSAVLWPIWPGNKWLSVYCIPDWLAWRNAIHCGLFICD
jgi:hypothetical protein